MLLEKGELLFFRTVAMKDTHAPVGGPPCIHTLGAPSGLLGLKKNKMKLRGNGGRVGEKVEWRGRVFGLD